MIESEGRRLLWHSNIQNNKGFSFEVLTQRFGQFEKNNYLCRKQTVPADCYQLLWIEQRLKAKKHLRARKRPRCSGAVWTTTTQHDGCI